MNAIQFKLHPPAQPPSWAISVSKRESKIVKIISNAKPELQPEQYIFHPKHFLSNDPSEEPKIIFLKLLPIVNPEEQTEAVQNEPASSKLEQMPTNQIWNNDHSFNGHAGDENVLATTVSNEPEITLSSEPYQSENSEELQSQCEVVPDAQSNLQPRNKDLLKINANSKLLTTMIELVSSGSNSSSEDQEVQEKQVYKSDKQKRVSISLTNKKSKPLFQRPLAKDIDEDLFPVSAKKSKNANYSHPKMVHPDSAPPGQKWNEQLSSYTIKKVKNLPPAKNMQIGENRKENCETVPVGTPKDSKRNKSICEMEFLTKRISESHLIHDSSSYPADDQRMTDFHSLESTSSAYQENVKNVHTHPKQSALFQGRAFKWSDDDSSFLRNNPVNNQVNNYQQLYKLPSVWPPQPESFSQARKYNFPFNYPDNRTFNYNPSHHNSTQPSFESTYPLFEDNRKNRKTFPQDETFIRKKHKNMGEKREFSPKLRIEHQTFKFYLNGQVQVDKILCSGVMKHHFPSVTCFRTDFIVDVVHLGPTYQEDHTNIFQNPDWRRFGLNVVGHMEISKVIQKLLLCSNLELVIAILKPDLELSSHMKCYTALFDHLDAKACTGVFSYEHQVNNYRKQKAYVYPIRKNKTLPAEIEMYVRDEFPPVDCRPNLLLMIVLLESAIREQ